MKEKTRLLQFVGFPPELVEKMKEACRPANKPIAVFVREAVIEKLAREEKE